MKICRFLHDGKIGIGIAEENFIFPVDDLENLDVLKNIFNTKVFFNISDVKILPPCIPSKIVCVGRNYSEHAAELGNAVPKEPLLFLKAPSSLITDGDEIIIPPQSNQVEHEGELGLIIGRGCKNLTNSNNPFDYILGYVCVNDVTARDLQRAEVQFTRAKSFDTFCPISSFIETESDVSNLKVTTSVNGEIKQTGLTSQMVYSVPFLVRYISNQMSLCAGDIIATGTPSGVSKLTAGDICRVEIEGIGILRNTVTV